MSCIGLNKLQKKGIYPKDTGVHEEKQEEKSRKKVDENVENENEK